AGGSGSPRDGVHATAPGGGPPGSGLLSRCDQPGLSGAAKPDRSSVAARPWPEDSADRRRFTGWFDRPDRRARPKYAGPRDDGLPAPAEKPARPGQPDPDQPDSAVRGVDAAIELATALGPAVGRIVGPALALQR